MLFFSVIISNVGKQHKKKTVNEMNSGVFSFVAYVS